MTDKEFLAIPDPSPELTDTSEPCPGKQVPPEGWKHQDLEKIKGDAQKII